MLSLSKEKTELIKSKNVDELPPLLMEEKKLLSLLEKVEQKRLQIVNPFFDRKNIIDDHRTVTTLLQLIEEESEKGKLEEKIIGLTNTIINLRQQEQLNNQLIQQSLQLIQLSLGMIQPTMQNMNYSKENKADQVSSRSMFDSKA